MGIQVAGIEKESIVDGEGIRLVIFFQGCHHHCDGCHNPETWSMLDGQYMDYDEIEKLMDENSLLTGITLSGGEPFLQPVGVKELSKKAHERGLTVWCYTGFTWEELVESHAYPFMQDIDVIVDGRFERDKRSLDLLFMGSLNQRLIDVQKSLQCGEIVLYNSVNCTSSY